MVYTYCSDLYTFVPMHIHWIGKSWNSLANLSHDFERNFVQVVCGQLPQIRRSVGSSSSLSSATTLSSCQSTCLQSSDACSLRYRLGPLKREMCYMSNSSSDLDEFPPMCIITTGRVQSVNNSLYFQSANINLMSQSVNNNLMHVQSINILFIFNLANINLIRNQ